MTSKACVYVWWGGGGGVSAYVVAFFVFPVTCCTCESESKTTDNYSTLSLSMKAVSCYYVIVIGALPVINSDP